MVKFLTKWPKIEVLHLWIVSPIGRNTFSIILSRIIQKWILLIEILSLGTSRDYAQISKGKGGT